MERRKGQKHSKHSVIVETMQMVDSKSNGAGNDGNTYNTPPQNDTQNRSDQIKTIPKVTVNDFNPFDDGLKEENISFDLK